MSHRSPTAPWVASIAALLAFSAPVLVTPPDEPEVKTLITSLPAHLTQPGLYRLAGPLTASADEAGIRIDSDDVVVDLGYHRLTAARTVGAAIEIVGPRQNVTIRHGTLIGGSRATLLAPQAFAARVIDVSVRQGRGDGIVVGAGARIQDCRVIENRGDGIRTGASAMIRGASVWGNGGDGVVVGPGSLIVQTTVAGNAGTGIVPDRETVVSEVTSTGNGVSGIRAADNLRISTTSGQGQRK